MIIQSCSIVSPAKCPMSCQGCVSQMPHGRHYPNLIRADREHRAAHEKNYQRRLEFARDNDCNTAIITGTGEPMADLNFLDQFAKINWTLSSPFRWIEIQTSGAYLTPENLVFLRDTVGVSTVSLSVWDVFDNDNNMALFQSPSHHLYDLAVKCRDIKCAGLNLRLSLNLTKSYESHEAWQILDRCRALEADQVTLRALYLSESGDTVQDRWVKDNRLSVGMFNGYEDYIKRVGRLRGYLSFGAQLYTYKGMSIVVDDDCMSQDAKQELKYVVLRPDCRLYRDWEGTLLF